MSTRKEMKQLWNSLTPADKLKIKKKMGVDPETITTNAGRYGLAAEYYAQAAAGHGPLHLQAALPVINGPPVVPTASYRSPHHLGTVVEDIADAQTMYPPRLLADHSPEIPGKSPTRIPQTFLNKAAEYVCILTLTVGGAYAGFSASRYTTLAKELRVMEQNPIINMYKIKHDLESFQWLQKIDIFSPDREQATRDKELTNAFQEGIEGIAHGAIDAVKGVIGLIPWVGPVGAYLIDQKQQEEQQEIRAYLQKRERHSLETGVYNADGAGSGLALGAILSLFWRRKNR